MKAWGREYNTVEDYIDVKIYPSIKGWEILRNREREKVPHFFEQMFNNYANKEDGSYLMSSEKLCEMYPDFLANDTLTVKKPRIVKSRMRKYLEHRNMTLKEWKGSIAAFAWNEPM